MMLSYASGLIFLPQLFIQHKDGSDSLVTSTNFDQVNSNTRVPKQVNTS